MNTDTIITDMQLNRAKVIDGISYRLEAVGMWYHLYDLGKKRCDEFGTGHHVNQPRSPAMIKTATATQIGDWPELAPWRGQKGSKPSLLWVRATVPIPAQKEISNVC